MERRLTMISPSANAPARQSKTPICQNVIVFERMNRKNADAQRSLQVLTGGRSVKIDHVAKQKSTPHRKYKNNAASSHNGTSGE